MRKTEVLIAREILQLNVQENVYDTRTQDEFTPRYDFGIVQTNGEITGPVPFFTTHLDDAESLIESMRRRFGAEFLLSCDLLGRYRAKFTKPNDFGWVKAETLSRVICHAALKSCGLD